MKFLNLQSQILNANTPAPHLILGLWILCQAGPTLPTGLYICSCGQHLLYDAENHYIQKDVCPVVRFNPLKLSER